MENNNQSSFWQFSDQLRVQTNNNLANLSLNDSIWSTSYGGAKRPEERRNFDIRVGGGLNSVDSLTGNNNSSSNSNLKTDFNGFNHSWKIDSSDIGSIGGSAGGQNLNGIGLNGGFNKGIYSKPSFNFNHNNNINNNVGINTKNNNGNKFGNGKLVDLEDNYQFSSGPKSVKKNKNKNSNNNNNSSENNSNGKNGVEKRFKTLPPSESLPRNETVGGYIFVCNNDTMQENLKRQLFGMYY